MSCVGRKLTDFTCFDLTQNKLLEIRGPRSTLRDMGGGGLTVCVYVHVYVHTHMDVLWFADLLLVSEELTVVL